MADKILKRIYMRLLFLLLLSLTACSHFDKKQFHSSDPTVTKEVFLKDKVDCQVMARQANAGNVFDDCMISKGYRLGHK
jgi:hypothetical protein